MRGNTHVTAGLTAALLTPNLSIPAMAALTLGSILPDIDHRDSLVGRHVPILPRLLKHRGVTHSLLFAVLCYGLYPPLGAGVLLHLLLDVLNPAGVALLWPWKKRLSTPVVTIASGGVLDGVLRTGLWVVLAAVVLHRFLGYSFW
ncbi:metal-dependent hydrolase [Candidatus Avoscillospira sp. LCP25S3_F1]|uniref:metal-dependent hydrolase n=1 Tax=Candidatus Avoscillospira sp. LCP25S3_F1 TaxID=3438825 RepID=UPI003F901056